MTKEEIKQAISMAEVVRRYGFQPNRANFIRCPFHEGDRSPSLKIYQDTFHCFGCGANGDVFTFVQKMESCSFAEAFRKLGGDSRAGMSDVALIRAKRRQTAHERREKRLEKARGEYLSVCDSLAGIKGTLDSSAPYSEQWCVAQNDLPATAYKADCLLEDLLNLMAERK